MEDRNVFNMLRQDIEIPEIVQNKVNIAFEQIINEIENDQNTVEKHEKTEPIVISYNKLSLKNNWKKLIIAILAATLAMASLTVGAEKYKDWKERAKEISGYSVSNEGVTISVKECIADDNFGLIILKVEGYDVQPNIQPGFCDMSVNIDGIGKDRLKVIPRFYVSSYTDETGGRITNYELEDGSLEYMIFLEPRMGEQGLFKGANVHVALTDLGIITEKAGLPEKCHEGTWELDAQFNEETDLYTATLDMPLGNTYTRVRSVELSPLSIHVIYDFDKITQEAPPQIGGIKLKDGTLITDIHWGPWKHEYSWEDGAFVGQVMTGHVLELENIEALLFINNELYDYQNVTEEMFYIVNIR